MRRALLLAPVLAACGSDAPALDPAPDGAVSPSIACTGALAGAYCGGDSVDGGDPNTLYACPGANLPPTSATPCSDGCVVEPPGTPDHCALAATAYRLPWRPEATMQLTQDCNDSCCGDHVGTDEYAYDWANGGSFTIVAARGGTITHLKINSTTGCGTSGCANQANVIVIDHGDGTQSTYLHLRGNSLEPGVACGATVVRGQALASSGTTGWSTGTHLHFQVSAVHPGAATCECGADGQACSPTTVPWSSFWVTQTYPTESVAFDEWPAAPQCGDRRITMPPSQNQ
jgi:hypothetical protein